MSATTIKLPPELKDRIAAVVEGTGKSAHAFMVEAIEHQTLLAAQEGVCCRSARSREADAQERPRLCSERRTRFSREQSTEG
jgi:predicted transcriptional regulator